ncbi:MAG: pyridoxamine 5'-phosphate oxidase family protein [Actinomycetales bacterium]|nr:pyridoxamine 5'-phosphate oxidase family protein [Tetrasphaera sp.]NLW98114.1 pyridoxamine 5'-phosphate oxidase family protein [Actinomycetales bacterium]
MTEYDPSPVEVEDANPVKKLTLEECWNLLESHEFGRLAYHLAGEVHIVPINYATDGKRIYFRTAEGSKLLGIVMNEDVAFEIDQVLGDFASSVVLRGRATLLEGEEEHEVESLPLRPWIPTLKYNVVAITPNEDEITGRAFDLSRPWTRILQE